EVEGLVARGALDGRAAQAVCDAAGASRAARPKARAACGLSQREVEVLRLLARGLSLKEIGRAVFISAGPAATPGPHLYAEIGVQMGVSSRGGAALFAVEQGLLPD